MVSATHPVPGVEGLQLVPMDQVPDDDVISVFNSGFSDYYHAVGMDLMTFHEYLSTNDIYLAGGKALSDEAAYEVARLLWEKNQDLGASHRSLQEWTRERMASPQVFIPYHSGAVRFYKEKGVWTPEMEAVQSKLLSE